VRIEGLTLAKAVCRILDDKKGEDIAILDVRELSGVTDYIVLATGGSPPHLKAMYGEVQQVLKKQGLPAFRHTGIPEGGWMVVDYVDVVVHILSRHVRDYYAFETLWASAPRMT
jgi:ribosome-associated protein